MTQLQLMISILAQNDPRLSVHTLSDKNGSYEHQPPKCARCQCEMILRGEIDVPMIYV